MIGIYEQYIDHIPVLIISNVKDVDTPLPTLIYYHGFTSAKENNLTIAYLLAEKGYRIILPDCLHHGVRLNHIPDRDRELAFWDIVLQSVTEVEQIKQYLEQKNLLVNGRIGIAGTSMGGMITAASITTYPWIRVAGILMGTAKLQSYAHTMITQFNKLYNEEISQELKKNVLEQIEEYDLFEKIDTLNERPLLIWHGKEDDVIPYSHAVALQDRIKKYCNHTDHIRFVPEESRGHHLSRTAIAETVSYFANYL